MEYKNKVIISIILLFFPALLFTQGKYNSFSIGVELQTGYGFVSGVGFSDPRPIENIAGEWLNEITHGYIISPRVHLSMPFGFRLYGGYHYGSFPEQNADADYWSNIYRQDMRNRFEMYDNKIRNTSRGFLAGISYAPSFLQYYVQPYFFTELRSERFESRTYILGRSDEWWSIFGLLTGEVSGTTLMRTKRVRNIVYGLGFEISLRNNIKITSEWKNHSGISPIEERIIRHEIGQENIYKIRSLGELDILDEQKIKMDYNSINFGIRYDFPDAFISHKMLFPKRNDNSFRVALELQVGMGFGFYGINGTITKERPFFGYFNSMMISDITNVYLLSGKAIMYVPYGMRIYAGYHNDSYPEDDVNSLFWELLFGLNSSEEYRTDQYQISNNSRGFIYGAAYAPPFLKLFVQPYVFGEIRSERLRLNKKLHGEVVQFQPRDINQTLTGEFEGNSSVITDRVIGFSYGVGIEKQWGRIVVSPEWRYLATSLPVLERRSNYSVITDNGEKVAGIVWLHKPEDEKIMLRYHSIQLGVRFMIF